MTAGVGNCCGSPSICGDDSCEIFSKHPVELARFVGASRPATELALPAIAVAPRRIGPIERLIAGPQGDPNLRSDFYSFLGCLACGVGLALVFLAIVLAGRVLLGGHS